jgi:hypothetical protein
MCNRNTEAVQSSHITDTTQGIGTPSGSLAQPPDPRRYRKGQADSCHLRASQHRHALNQQNSPQNTSHKHNSQLSKADCAHVPPPRASAAHRRASAGGSGRGADIEGSGPENRTEKSTKRRTHRFGSAVAGAWPWQRKPGFDWRAVKQREIRAPVAANRRHVTREGFLTVFPSLSRKTIKKNPSGEQETQQGHTHRIKPILLFLFASCALPAPFCLSEQ